MKKQEKIQENEKKDQEENVQMIDIEKQNEKTERWSQEQKQLIDNMMYCCRQIYQENMQKYIDFLQLISKFPGMSLYNLLLLNLQMPKATLVAGEQAWEENYHVSVRENQQAIALIRPTTNEEETILGYQQIPVFDILQVNPRPEIYNREYDIEEFCYKNTGVMSMFDTDGMIPDEEEYEVVDDELLVRNNKTMNEAFNNKNRKKQHLFYYIDMFSPIAVDATADMPPVKRGILVQSIKYILCHRYKLPLPQISGTLLPNACVYGFQLLQDIVVTANAIMSEIEEDNYITLDFSDLAFVNMLVEANSYENYAVLENYKIANDDEVLKNDRENFLDKLNTYIEENTYHKIYEDRKNGKTMTMPPYKIKLTDA